MNENTISKISHIISNTIDLNKCKNEVLSEIDVSILEVNKILEKEKVRIQIVKNEIEFNKKLDNTHLLNYLKLIQMNIEKLTFFLEILENKKNILFFDAKNYFKSMKNININEAISEI